MDWIVVEREAEAVEGESGGLVEAGSSAGSGRA